MGENLKQGVFFCTLKLHVIFCEASYTFIKTGRNCVANCGKQKRRGGDPLAKAKKARYGPKLDNYIREGKRRNYATYAKTASFSLFHITV